MMESLGLYTFIIVVSLLAMGDSYLTGLVNAIMPEIVPKTSMDKAYQNTFILQSAVNILGVAGGIISVEVLSLSYILIFASLITFVSSILFFTIRYHSGRVDVEAAYFSDMLDGLKLSWHYKTEFFWNLISSFSNFVIVPIVSILIPYHVSNVVEANSYYVISLEICLTFGVFVASTRLYGVLQSFFSKMQLVRLAFFGVGVSVGLLSLFDELLVWHIAVTLLGFFIIVNNISIESVRALAIPSSCRSRLQIIHQIFIQGSIPIGFYIFSENESVYFDLRLLTLYAFLFILLSFVIPWIPKLKDLLLLEAEELDGAYRTLFDSN